MAVQWWDDRLLSQAEAYAIAAGVEVAWHIEDSGRVILRHVPCGQSCGVWAAGRPTDLDDMTAAVIRHLVTAHDLPMNRPARERQKVERDSNGSTGDGRPAEGRRTRAAAHRRGPGARARRDAPDAAGDDLDGAHGRAGKDDPE
jgi:hypothetical protein